MTVNLPIATLTCTFYTFHERRYTGLPNVLLELSSIFHRPRKKETIPVLGVEDRTWSQRLPPPPPSQASTANRLVSLLSFQRDKTRLKGRKYQPTKGTR